MKALLIVWAAAIAMPALALDCRKEVLTCEFQEGKLGGWETTKKMVESFKPVSWDEPTEHNRVCQARAEFGRETTGNQLTYAAVVEDNLFVHLFIARGERGLGEYLMPQARFEATVGKKFFLYNGLRQIACVLN